TRECLTVIVGGSQLLLVPSKSQERLGVTAGTVATVTGLPPGDLAGAFELELQLDTAGEVGLLGNVRGATGVFDLNEILRVAVADNGLEDRAVNQERSVVIHQPRQGEAIDRGRRGERHRLRQRRSCVVEQERRLHEDVNLVVRDQRILENGHTADLADSHLSDSRGAIAFSGNKTLILADLSNRRSAVK